MSGDYTPEMSVPVLCMIGLVVDSIHLGSCQPLFGRLC